MKRRKFLKLSSALGIVPLLSQGLPIRSIAATSPMLLNPCAPTDRSIVVVYLNGGNDIFNTTVPLNQHADYANFRADTYLPQNQLINLDNTLPTNQQIGLHPSLTGLKSLYDNGLLNIVQGVGHAQPNKSHFKALDNWLTSSGGAENYGEGWLGRFLNNRYPSYNGLPFSGELDPLGMLFGRMNNAGFHTHDEHNHEIVMSGKDSQGFYSVISSIAGEPILNMPNTEQGGMLSFMEGVATSLNVYAQRVQTTFGNGINSSVVYPNSDLSNQLKTVAKMLSGGSRTKVFMTTTGGFDTHVAQIDQGSTTTGGHANLLQNIGDSVKAFQDDLTALGLDNKVLTVIFSEFGRKIVQNGSFGTDHGTLSSMFLVGSGVEGGVTGNNVDLQNQDNQGAPNPNQTQYDYRQVYSTVLQDWLGANDGSIDTVFNNNLGNSYTTQKLPLINIGNVVPSSCHFTPLVQTVCACLQVKVMMEGFYNSNTNEMTTGLMNTGLSLNQPYNYAPFNYSGTESISSPPNDMVDWILLELRQADDLTQVVDRQAALLRKDGIIMQLDGTPGVAFNNVVTGTYHLAIFHRNHLGVVSSIPVVLDNVNYVYDFTQADWKAHGLQQQKQIGNNIYGMYAGDLNGDNIINNQDYNYYKLNTGNNVGYARADINGDGNSDLQDQNLWQENRSKIGKL
ncbi:MAG: DUF1501 domain-containing protein [Saprospiraceae bacterium]